MSYPHFTEESLKCLIVLHGFSGKLTQLEREIWIFSVIAPVFIDKEGFFLQTILGDALPLSVSLEISSLAFLVFIAVEQIDCLKSVIANWEGEDALSLRVKMHILGHERTLVNECPLVIGPCLLWTRLKHCSSVSLIVFPLNLSEYVYPSLVFSFQRKTCLSVVATKKHQLLQESWNKT